MNEKICSDHINCLQLLLFAYRGQWHITVLMSGSTVAPGGLSDLRLPGILGEKLGFEPSLEKAWETQLEGD